MKAIRWLSGLVTVLVASPVLAQTYTVTPILKNGPDVDKKVVVVIGDGYAQADQTAWQNYVETNVLGAFRNDEYLRNHNTAFNIYRVDVVSPVSGVSIKRYSAGCTTFDTKTDDVVDAACNSTSTPVCYTHDTALDFIYTNCWGRCWIEGSSTTEASIKTILDSVVPKRDYEIRVVNVATGETGGCGGGAKLVVTGSSNWKTLAHEFGHMAPGLHDEYVASATANTNYPKSINDRNCSTNTANSVWKSYFTPGISIPTVYDPATMDDNTTVGMFEGCDHYGKGVYRPAQKCRMNSNDREYCPVCRGVFDDLVDGFLDTASDFVTYENRPGALCKAVNDKTVTYSTSGTVENGTAASIDVICPARRNRDANGNFENWFYGEAFVVDRSSTADVCCSVFVRDTGGQVKNGPSVCSAGSSTGNQHLKLGLPKVNWDYTYAHYGVQCSIPATSGGNKSSVLTYRVGGQRY